MYSFSWTEVDPYDFSFVIDSNSTSIGYSIDFVALAPLECFHCIPYNFAPTSSIFSLFLPTILIRCPLDPISPLHSDI